MGNDIQMACIQMKFLLLLMIKEIQILLFKRDHFSPIRLAEIKKFDNAEIWLGCGKMDNLMDWLEDIWGTLIRKRRVWCV